MLRPFTFGLGRLSFFVGLLAIAPACDSARDDGRSDTGEPAKESEPATETEAEPVACGAALAELTPWGNTYDDSNPKKGSTTGPFEMFVYARGDGDAGTGPAGGSWERHSAPGGGCSSEGLLTRSIETVSLPPGVYDVCSASGACGCMLVRLTGGPARVIWEAGPANRFHGTGCIEVIEPLGR